MTIKKQMIEIIKLENPDGLQVGDEINGYIKLNQKEAETVFEQWAEARIAKELRKAEIAAKEAARQAILDRLGLTADEAKLLLG